MPGDAIATRSLTIWLVCSLVLQLRQGSLAFHRAGRTGESQLTGEEEAGGVFLVVGVFFKLSVSATF